MSRSLLTLAAVALLICAAGCSVPLAPGYHIVKETRQIHFVPGNPPALHIRAEYTLLNTGKGALHFVDVRLPSPQSFGRKNLRVEIDGRAIVPAPLPPADLQRQPGVVRLTFETPWKRKQRRRLRFDYTLQAPSDWAYGVSIEPLSFHLGLRGWAPQMRPPKYVLSTYPSRPGRIRYTIRVPADFAVLAGGARKKQKKFGTEVEYLYQSGSGDLEPFVVAGRYVRWPAQGARAPAEFWTARLPAGHVARAAQNIALVWKTLNTDFGVLNKRLRIPVVVESSSLRTDLAGRSGPAAVGVPGAALVNPAAIALGLDSDRFARIVSQALARGWFDGAVIPSTEAEIGMGQGLPEYASIVTDEALNGPLARRQRIYAYLRRYDHLTRYAQETPIAATTFASPLAQRQIALAKAPLFYIELEDACGAAPVRAGLVHMLTSMRGQEVDYNILRSVLEESTDRELGKLFREWLRQTGIPKNFRARYRYGDAGEQVGN